MILVRSDFEQICVIDFPTIISVLSRPPENNGITNELNENFNKNLIDLRTTKAFRKAKTFIYFFFADLQINSLSSMTQLVAVIQRLPFQTL